MSNFKFLLSDPQFASFAEEKNENKKHSWDGENKC